MIPHNSCPSILTAGVCEPAGCALRHDVPVRVCLACNVMFPTLAHFNQHKRTDNHKRHVKAQESGRPTLRANQRYCDPCRVILHEHGWAAHISNPSHAKRVIVSLWKLQLAQAQGDQIGLTVEGPTGFGVVGARQAAGSVTRRLVAKTTGSALFTFSSATPVGESPFHVTFPGKNRAISREKPVVLDIHFTHANIGRYSVRLEMEFRYQQLGQRFMITRTLSAVVGDASDHTKFAPTSPYVRRARSARQPVHKVVPGEPPTAVLPKAAVPYLIRLLSSPVPKMLKPMLSRGTLQQIVANVQHVCMPPTFGAATHGNYFKQLIWIEEISMDKDLATYDMEGVALTPHASHYWLTVPGLAEKRPSVLLGDCILVHKQGTAEGLWYEGRVEAVQEQRVDLRFSKKFKATANNMCDVQFKLNRVPLQRQHQALDMTSVPARVLFPIPPHILTPVSPIEIRTFINSLVSQNPRQRQAVSAILSQPAGSAPFVIFGPPGTGKTVTVVETINQILKKSPKARILACAPSNSAADVIALRLLLTIDKQRLFRMYAPSRMQKEVPAELLPFTHIHRDNTFAVPPLEQLREFSVIISTCVASSMLYGVGIDREHFNYIFVDEAGQGTEPEAMVSIRTLVGDATNIILSGDPKQLGPIIRSEVARELGLGKSFLERLMENPVYDEVTGLGRTVVKLTKNFRTHQAILQFPNEKFYRGDLEACGDPGVINSFINSDFLVRKIFPVVFYAIPGNDLREASSPSFFNIEEITAVKEYVQELKARRISDRDIGVIAPYRAQCQKLRQALKGFAADIKVGSVEEFQGQERLVMIISTVRSSQEFLEYDLRHTLGFVSSPRRFNVAVTRAKALLLVVGDPNVLSLDPLWRTFLNYIHNNGGWRGDSPAWDTHATVDQDGTTYAEQRRQSAEADIDALNSRITALAEEYEARDDRPPFVEVE